MKLILILLCISLSSVASDLYKFNLQGSGKKKIALKSYENKAILFVNIATRCGYTGQLEGLEKLYKTYKEQGLTVIGIPSNDFGSQTPEDDKGVAKFCKLNYGVTFPLTRKMIVKGSKKSELYKYFLSKTDNKEIGWNFTKFLFDKSGNLVNRYSSSVEPSDVSLLKDIKKALKK